MNDISELIDLLDLERIEENIFRGQSYKTPWGAVYGGQVLAQAFHAAAQTVPEERVGHSMHGYFILKGDINLPIIYEVDQIRDGGSFTTRRVVAIQKGRPIFNMSASFQLRQEGFEHQFDMPNVPPPEGLLNDTQLAETRKEKIPEAFKLYRQNRPIELRPVERYNYGMADDDPSPPGAPTRHVWMKAKGTISKPMSFHQSVLAYASDTNLLGTALLPHRHKISGFGDLHLASLDHAMWFHREFSMDEWLLYALDSPSASNSRGFCRGNVFNQQGVLVASVVQEGLIRKRRKKKTT